ncbi:S1/P1 nuclease [Motilimonas pumila]|uniref:S1/P1 Nuclease n=1 Tax=Motilimonas pumila TaxID=2303987 RepID=A0A418Y9X2_9GAMM|nr:S1/P1 nuclease [Motilimonas pumila]RJG38590.1 hypothetical protein D1Z90_18935 [Motilimonas pumila]
MRAFVAISGLLLSSQAFAWNDASHVIINEIAYQSVNASTQQILDTQASAALAHFSTEELQKIREKYQGVSDFALIPLIPEMEKLTSIGEVFELYAENVPSWAELYKEVSLNDWHALTHSVNDDGCELPTQTTLLDGIKEMPNVYRTAQSPAEQGLALAYLSHLTADLHQPLNNFTKTEEVNGQCVSDNNGKDYCLENIDANQQCPIDASLYHYWNSGMNTINDADDVKQYADKLLILFPQSRSRNLEWSPQSWSQEHIKLADFIYSSLENSAPSPAYKRLGLRISQKRIAIAGYRLAIKIEELQAKK